MLEIGSLVDGKYRILRVVGKGGMSVVYQAVNEKANKIWAIKEVRKDGVQNFEIVKQNLVVETELLKRLNHPNLPSIIDVIDTEDSFLIVMDYIEGNSLSKAIETSGAQSQEDVIEWAKQLCDVLGYLHSREKPIIYRDMKPANVMLKPDGNVSLIDFGTAREFKSSSVEDTTCLGTQGYAAPEQYGGHGQTDARTDIYCLGATMYHLVTGHNPSKPPYEMYPIRQWNPLLSSGLEEIICKCTQRNPNDRYQSCAELLYALEHYQESDIEVKKVRELKWKVFLTSVIITLVMLVSAVGFKIAAGTVTSNEYDTFITDAENAQNTSNGRDAAIKAYKDAINTDSGRLEAYDGLLKLYADADSMLDQDEYKDINSLMVEHESELKSGDSNDYADLCKTLGDDLLFLSESKNAVYASNWYNKAAMNYSSDEDREKANYLANFAKSYQNVGQLSAKDNDNGVRQYFDTLSTLVSGSDFESMSLVAQLKCCEFISSQLYTRNSLLLANGITQDEYEALLNQTQSRVDSIRNGDYYKQVKDQNPSLERSVNTTADNLRNARTILTGSDSGLEGAGV